MKRKSLLDPRTKLAVFLTASLSAFSGLSHSQEAGLLMLCIVTLCLCRQWRFVGKLVLLFGIMLLTDTFVAGRLTGGLQFMVLTLCRGVRFMLPICAAAYAVIHTADIGAYISAFMAMHMPNTLIIPIAIMFRFIPTLKEEWTAINRAMRLRGIALEWKNIVRCPMDMLEYSLVPFLLQASAITDELSAAVMARGFDKDCCRSSYVEVKLTGMDYLMLVLCMVCLIWTWIV